MDGTGYDRDKTKKKYMAVVYGYPEPAEGTKTGRAFRAAFPHLWKVLKELNAPDNGRLPRFLQTVESWLVIWRTCGRLAREHPGAPLLTVHDCLVTTERFVEPFRRALVGEFRAVWGEGPQTDVKPLAA